MDITKSIYNKILKYGDISESEFQTFFSNFELLTLSKDDYFYTPKDNMRIVAIQIDGLLRSYVYSDRGDERTQDFCRAGDILSTFDFDRKSMNWIQAIIDTTVATIQNDKLEELVSQNYKIQRLILKMMESCLSFKSKRELELLSLDAKERYLTFLVEYKDIIEYIPQTHIASYLGISPVSLSRLKKGLVNIC